MNESAAVNRKYDNHIDKRFPNSHSEQGGRTWQAFGGGKNGHETFRQARMTHCQMLGKFEYGLPAKF